MMSNLKTALVLALVTLGGACSRPVTTTPVPVPGPAVVPARVVERAALPPSNPALPPVPDIRGPVRIKVVYPDSGQLIQSRDSNFIFGSVGSGDAGLKINGMLVPVWPNGAFMGWIPVPSQQAPFYELVATNGLDTARLSLPVKLLPPKVLIPRDTLPVDTTRRDTTFVTQYALIAPPGSVSDTDRLAIGRPAPGNGQEYKWFLFPGTPVKVTGSRGDFARIELDSAAPIWIQKSDIAIQPASYVPPVRIAGSAARVEAAAQWIDLIVPTNTPPAYLTEESNRSISVLLYGTTAESVVSALPMSVDKYVAGVSVETLPGRIKYTVNLSRAPYGYLAMYQNGAFVLRVRRPPVIADANNPLRGLTITVDPGHPPAGATGPTSLYEGEAVLAVGLRLRDLLLQKGVNVVMTRTTMDPVDLGLRPIISRRANANAFISLHLDAEPDGVNPATHAATACYYFWPHSRPMAELTIAILGPAMSTPILGAKFQNLAVNRGTWMPAMLCEGGFIILPDVEAALRTPQYQDAYARGILAGIESYFESLARAQ
ncbi:MAG: N-acetylmuramoyl-L-alanine amidase [Gemmatimonadota bacterium]|nr:N-acetylmuramoyl-L-alanine amidase [Gemmatimonadota bacterium]